MSKIRCFIRDHKTFEYFTGDFDHKIYGDFDHKTFEDFFVVLYRYIVIVCYL